MMMMRAMSLAGSIAIILCLVLPTTTAQEVALSAVEINVIEASLGQKKRQHPPGFSPVDPDLLCLENGYDRIREDCDKKYHTFDGSCNNLFHVNWGKAGGPLGRFIDPDYGDGESSPRRASDGSELPNPRRISTTITIRQSPVSDTFTALMMSFGQFLDHDFALSPESLVVCDDCIKEGECDPIPIEDDYFFPEETECLRFTRSQRVRPANCARFPEEQLNIVSSYIDLSMVYGSTQEVANSLRDSDLGLLRSVPNPRDPTRKEYLPFDDNNEMCAEDGDIRCGLAGDFRAPEQVGLTSLHTMFLREHNRVARELASINPLWGDERLYQESRRILIALWQNIVFKEYIHLLIGRGRANFYDLFPRSNGRMLRNHYDPTEDVTVLNEFSTACFRMGHSMIPPCFNRVDKFYNETFDTLKLNFAFFNATHIFDFDQGGMDSISLGLTTSPLMRVDQFFTTKVTNQLFADPAEGHGSDLVALNIQRGRDHGIPGYTAVLQSCSEVIRHRPIVIETFDDLKPYMSDDVIEKFKELYKSVHDIDLFIGATAENPLPGAILGPTFACVIGVQFHKFKHADRFWFENAGHEGEFTTDQVNEIRKASLARIFCNNLDNIETIQPRVLLRPDEGFIDCEDEPTEEAPEIPFFPRRPPVVTRGPNSRVMCSNTRRIPIVNLEKWKES